MIEKAIKIALDAHSGQVDKANKPYILHPLRLMLKMKNELDMITAVLHDVLEDSSYTEVELLREGVPEDVVNAVKCMTKDGVQTYESYLAQIKTNDMASRVKIADIEDNIDLTRLKNINSRDLDRIAKYHKALINLKND